MLTRNASNEEIKREFKDLTQPVVFAIEEATHPDYLVLYLAQEQEVEPGEIKKNSITEVQKRLLGWKDDTRVVRCVQTIDRGIAESLPVIYGYVFEKFDIVVFDSDEPAYVGHEPKKDSSNEIILTNGRLMYEHSHLGYNLKKKIPSKIELEIRHTYPGASPSNTAASRKINKDESAKPHDPVEVIKEHLKEEIDELPITHRDSPEEIEQELVQEIIAETKQEEETLDIPGIDNEETTMEDPEEYDEKVVKARKFSLLD